MRCLFCGSVGWHTLNHFWRLGRLLTIKGVDLSSMGKGCMYTQESESEQGTLHKLSVNGPDLITWSLSPKRANKAWRITLLSLSVIKAEALRHAELQEGHESARPVTQYIGMRAGCC